MKKKDLILAGGILLLAGLLALGLYLRKPENGNLLKITVDGEVYGTYALSKNQTIPIETSHGTNQLVIKNGIIVNPARKQHEKGDIVIENGKILSIGGTADTEGAEVYDANCLFVAP